MDSSNPISEIDIPLPKREDAASSTPNSQFTVPESSSSSNTATVLSNEGSITAASLDAALSSLTLSEPSADRMFRALATIFEASQHHDARIALDASVGEDIWTQLRHADSQEGRGIQDLQSLIAVKNVMDQMLLFQSQFLLPAAKLVADKSRDVSWRQPIGQAGFLSFGSSVLTTDGASDDLKTQALRLIGNACADTDENRQRILQYSYFPTIIDQLRIATLAAVAVPVLYNICCDFGPAQTQAFHDNILSIMIDLLVDGVLDSTPSFSYLCRLLDMSDGNVDEHVSPIETVNTLLEASIRPGIDLDDAVSLTDAAILHLKYERFQRHLVESDGFPLVLKWLLRTYSEDVDLSIESLPESNSFETTHRDAEDEREIIRVRNALIQASAEVSSLSVFTSKYKSLESPTTHNLEKWLFASQTSLQQFSCITLGNLACSDEICCDMVSDSNISKGLFAILRSSSDSSLLHAALGYLRNLALPEDNKSALGAAGAIDILRRFWTSEPMPQILHLAAAVIRQLVNGSLPNVRKLLTSLSSDKNSPAFSRTYLSLLLSTYEKSDEVAVKTEIARIITAVLRCIHGQQTLQPARDELLFRLYTLHPELTRPLAGMVIQAEFPVIRSEGWFGFALVARSERGRQLVSSVVTDISVFGALEQAVKGGSDELQADTATLSASPLSAHASPISPGSRSSGSAQQEQEMKLKDRQNAMILLNELLRNGDEATINGIERDQLEDLLQSGSRANQSSSIQPFGST